MRHLIGTCLLAGLALGLLACNKPADAAVEPAPVTPMPEAERGTVGHSGPQEQTGTVERTATDEQTGTVERAVIDEQTGTVERAVIDEQTGTVERTPPVEQ